MAKGTRQMILAEIARLPGLGLDDLRERWRRLFDEEPPSYGRRFLVERLAYRMQELELGGLSDETRRRMDALLEEAGCDEMGRRTRGKKNGRRPAEQALLPGTLITREWRGERYEVSVLPRGFEYQGRPYRSLSAIAREITGGHWNGRLFFGVGPRRKPRGLSQQKGGER